MNNELYLPEHLSLNCRDLIAKVRLSQSHTLQLLDRDIAARLGSARGAEEVKEHPYFADVDWDALYRRKSLQFTVPEPYLAQYAKSIIEV